MPPESKTSVFGILRFMPLQMFIDSNFDSETLVADMLGQTRPRPSSDWPKIIDCIRTDSVISVMAVSPVIRAASLKFEATEDTTDPFLLGGFPVTPQAGTYQIRYHSHSPEQGWVHKATALESGLFGELLHPLRTYRYRYSVITTADDPTHSHMVWLIGINHYRPNEIDPETRDA